MKQIIAVVLFFSFFPGLQAQNVRVLNSRTAKPIEGVLVLTDACFSRQTNGKGMVSLDSIPPGEQILFQHSSFLKYSSTKEKLLERGRMVFLQEDPVRLDEVVVSVNRWQQSKTEIPHKIETLHPEEVLRYNPQTAADMLGTQGGIFIQKSQMGGGSPMIRGFAANRVLIVVDGIRMNNAIFRSGNLHNVIALDANTLENTEVIFGPGSVIYGSDALGGVMSFNTSMPKLSTTSKTELRSEFFSRYSSANAEKTVHGSFSYGKKRWAALVSATFSGFDDLRMGAHGPEEYLRQEYVSRQPFDGTDEIVTNETPRLQKFSGYNQFNLLSKLRYRPGERMDVVFSAIHSRTSAIPRYDRLIACRGDQLRYAAWHYGPQKWTLFSGQAKYRENHLLFDKVNVLAGWQQYTESRHDRGLNSEVLRHRIEELNIFSFNLDFGKTFGGDHEIFYGGEFFFNRVGSEATAEHLINREETAIASRYPDGSVYQSFAAYLSYKYHLSDQLIFQTGARYTRTMLQGDFDADFYAFPFRGFDMKNGALNGNLGMVWHPGPHWQVNVNASTGFRSPNIDDVAKVFDSEPGNVIVPNPGLEPEFARNIEMGIIRSFPGKARFEVTGFFTRLKNAMVRRDFSLNGQDSIVYDGILSKVEALVNAESANVYGSSVSFEYLFSRSLRTHHDVTFTFGADDEGIPMRHVPPPFGSSHLTLEWKEWFVDLFAEYSAGYAFEALAPSEKDKPHLYPVDKNGDPWSPPWWTLNVKSSCQLSDAFTVSGGVENILNQRYRRYSSGIVSPGINFIVSLRLQL